MRGRYVALTILLAASGIGIGVGLERFYLNYKNSSSEGGEAEILYWVAPMDANYRREDPGKSPMGMDLIPVYKGQESDSDASSVKLSAAEINTIGVRTAIAEREAISQRIDTVGFVRYNDYLTSHIHMRSNGWIENLAVRAQGDKVTKGERLFTIYAPEIVVAVADLIRTQENSSVRNLEDVKVQLRNFGVSDRQIYAILRSKQITRYIDVYAPRDGVVTMLDAADGMYIKPETRVMSIVDLSSVWLVVDVFEKDIARLQDGQKAMARFDSLPGQIFEGEVEYIYPELDPKTRTLPVRLKFDNREGLLRPNMFGSVSLMPSESQESITIPSEALIQTGRSERVILKTSDTTFKPRFVVSGLRDSFGEGGRVEILQGLSTGDEIVASAHFLIDSESSLSAGTLRMMPTEQTPAMTEGFIRAIDTENHQVTLDHEAVAALDWPPMRNTFTVLSHQSLDGYKVGDKIRASLFMGADNRIAIAGIKSADGVSASGKGQITAIKDNGRVTVTHEPIPALGWPAMTMDMPIASTINKADIPLKEEIVFDLAKGQDGMFTIVAIQSPMMKKESASPDPDPLSASAMAKDDPDQTAADYKVVIVLGTLNQLDREKRLANISHETIKETGMPGMTMDFAVDDKLKLDQLKQGQRYEFTFRQEKDLSLKLLGAKAEGMIMEEETRP